MSILSRLVGPAVEASADPLDDKYYDTGNYVPALAGVNLGGDASLRQATFYRCVSIRANAFATLPLGFYKRTGKTRVEVTDDPVAKVFERPNPWQSCFSFRRQVQVDLLLKGNAFLQIVYRGQGELWLVPLDPDRVTGPTVNDSGDRIYSYRDQKGQTHQLLGDSDVWHLQTLSAAGSRGLGLIDAARETLGISISAERHSALFFRRGVKVNGVLEHPKTLKPETAKEMSRSFSSSYGGESGAGKTPVLWEGMTFRPISMNNRDAQFLETYKEGSVGIATFCGVPPHMVGQTERSTSWGTGIEEQRSDFVTFTVLPDCKMFEEEVERVFLDGREDIYLRFNVNALLRGKTLERFQVYEIAVRSHIFTPNMCLALEDMDPLPGGDEFPAVPGAQVATEAQPKQMKAEIPEDFARAGVLAGSLAVRLLTQEAEELAALAAKHSKDPAKWRAAVGSFYGRHAATVASAMDVSAESAAEFCREQERLAVEGGAAALETWAKDHKARLVALALGRLREAA